MSAGELQTLWLPQRFPGLNEITNANRTHWTKGAKQKKTLTFAVSYKALEVGLKPVTSAVDLTFVWYEPNQKRDLDNISAGAKFILDGLVKAKILPTDGQKCVRTIRHALIGEDFRDGLVGVRVEIYERSRGSDLPWEVIPKPAGEREYVVTVPSNPKREIRRKVVG